MTWTRSTGPLCVSLLLLLSGCSESEPGSDSPAFGEVTPAETSTQDNSDDPVKLVPRPSAFGRSDAIVFIDQGNDWTEEQRQIFYTQDQGARIMPLTWMQALKQADGMPFLQASLSRYGFLENTQPVAANVPVGFALENQSGAQWIGMTCSACHSRQIKVEETEYRIDGGPAIIDADRFFRDLDSAVGRVAGEGQAFDRFVTDVLGSAPSEDEKAALRSDLDLWHLRNHTWTKHTLHESVNWGPGRMDAVTMIFNRIGGLGVGTPPDYIIESNMKPATAPTRYPFLWNAWRQDCTQWAGVSRNGTRQLAQARNLGQVYGLFSDFHPRKKSGSYINHDFLGINTANFPGLLAVEDAIEKISPPQWQWEIADAGILARGRSLFEETCASCHGVKENPENDDGRITWQTPIISVGTDTKQWEILGGTVSTGELVGADVPDFVYEFEALKETDDGIRVLFASVVGTLVDCAIRTDISPCTYEQGEMASDMVDPESLLTEEQLEALADLGGMYSIGGRYDALEKDGQPSQCAGRHATCNTQACYEARVLHGVWAAAPYLHNGSVPTLDDLLTPAEGRPSSFSVGPAYDTDRVGLAADQGDEAREYITTGCEDVNSGNSRCGHEFGVDLPPADKRALIEYLKTL